MEQFVICEKQELVDVADAIRSQSGTTNTMSLKGMVTAISNISGGSGGGVQSDWNVNDSNDPAYVKNRPFYTESSEPTTIIEEATYSFAPPDISKTP